METLRTKRPYNLTVSKFGSRKSRAYYEEQKHNGETKLSQKKNSPWSFECQCPKCGKALNKNIPHHKSNGVMFCKECFEAKYI